MSKLNHVEFGGIVYPPTKINNVLIVDYPPLIYDPKLTKKITEEGRKNLEKLKEMTSKFIKEFDVKIIINDKEY